MSVTKMQVNQANQYLTEKIISKNTLAPQKQNKMKQNKIKSPQINQNKTIKLGAIS